MVGVGGLKMDALQVPDFLSKKLSTVTNCTSTLEEVFLGGCVLVRGGAERIQTHKLILF